MNNKTGLTLRLILGGYLVFLGVSVIYQAVQTKPSDMVIKVLFGALFILVGGVYAIAQIRKVYQIVKKETEDTTDDNDKKGSQPLFTKPQHDEFLYRTAPMPAESIGKKISAQSTDLRANMTQMMEEEKEATAQAGENESKVDVKQNENKENVQNKEQTEQKKQPLEQVEPKKEAESGSEEEKKQEAQETKPQSSQTGIQIEEKKAPHMEVKDPVSLAIEIMRNEDKELAKQAEELEKDYEEK